MLDHDQARLYELIWLRTIASQMESAELERTTVDITAKAGARTIDLRANGTVVKFDGFLTLYTEDQDDKSDDEDANRLPQMATGEPLQKREIAATQHFTEPPPRYSEASLVKRMEELGIGRPSTYASILQVLRDRGYVRLDKKRLVPEDKGRVLVAFLENFFPATSNTISPPTSKSSSTRSPTTSCPTRTCCATSGRTSSARSTTSRSCASRR